ncbi:hypothetical protein AVEN_58338-1 [Araneus ventricosus]|uniref:Uncharacterized protein n=1 Tax=Araneus ventricosus TaxID=182803 RepID=A0A4Y2TZL2_ARAVE|nr:hypothetical protein AVEN_58338-1 [Araneus ventricosus]
MSFMQTLSPSLLHILNRLMLFLFISPAVIVCGYQTRWEISKTAYSRDCPRRQGCVSVIYVYRGTDAAKLFVSSMLKEEEDISSILKKIISLSITTDEEKLFKSAVNCHICVDELKKDRVRDHDHLTENFKWESPELWNEESMMQIPDEMDTGFVSKVDLEYPEEIHDAHNCLPVAAEKIKTNKAMLSSYQLNLSDKLGSKSVDLIANLYRTFPIKLNMLPILEM